MASNTDFPSLRRSDIIDGMVDRLYADNLTHDQATTVVSTIIRSMTGALVDGLYKHLKPEDFEKRGERFKDVTPPELPKKVVPQSGKSDDAQSKPATKQEEPAKALN